MGLIIITDIYDHKGKELKIDIRNSKSKIVITSTNDNPNKGNIEQWKNFCTPYLQGRSR